MTNGANHAGAIYVGDLDAWTFTAAQGDYLVVSIGETLQSEIDPLFLLGSSARPVSSSRHPSATSPHRLARTLRCRGSTP
jgi:hypothetical protein